MTLTRKQLTVSLAAALAVGGTVALTAMRVQADSPPPPAPLVEVDVAPVASKTITDWQSYSGRLEAVDKVEIRPLASGTITAVHFKDGALVHKGDVLFTIDPRPYQAELERAQAQLAAAEARNAFTESDQARAQRLIADNAIARRDLDEKNNAAHEAAANLKAAQAAVTAARLNLGYTQVVAPVSGRVSRAELTVGNVVSSGSGTPVLTTVVSVSPIYASFNVDEQTYLQYLGKDHGKPVPVALGLANEDGYSRQGQIASVDNRLDTATGTIRVRARFDNADGTLLPGLYARVKVGGGTPHPAVLIDDSAVGTDQDKKFALVVDGQNKVQYRPITLGTLYQGQRVVVAGLQPGERIVVNGLQRVRPGMPVKPHAVPMPGESSTTAAAQAPAAQRS